MAEKSFSKIGIVSFICGLLFPFTFYVSYQFPYKSWSMNITIVGSIFTAISAFIGGIICLFQKKTQKIFGIIGFAFGLIEVIYLTVFGLIIWAFVEIFGRK